MKRFVKEKENEISRFLSPDETSFVGGQIFLENYLQGENGEGI